MKSDYEKAVTFVKSAKKLEKKGKMDKAKDKYQKAQKLLIKSNKKKPNKPNTLNYLGFTTRKLGDFENGENIISKVWLLTQNILVLMNI